MLTPILTSQPIRVGIDVGGTFTDVILIDSMGHRKHVKVASTPDDPSKAVLRGLQKALLQGGITPDQVDFLLHGSTVATNTVLQRKGAKVNLIITKGFRDLLEIGRQQRPSLYDLFGNRVSPLVPRQRCYEVRERISPDGCIINQLSDNEARTIAKKVSKKGEAVAVCLLFAYQNPIHEQQLRSQINRISPDLHVSLSSVVLPEFREYERASTTVLDAYVQPVISNYLKQLEIKIRENRIDTPLLIMQNNGGVLQSSLARQFPAKLLFSGLAGGALGGRYTSQILGENNIIAFDMGGTSTDVTLIKNGIIKETAEGQIGGLPCRLPMVDVETVGAGGGSIAWVDEAKILHVGPQSAGADPGPVSYGRGGQEPTVTDANLSLGRLNPNYFLGGQIQLNQSLAYASINMLAKKIGLRESQCAFGIIRVVNANMERAIRVVSIQRGHDPRDFALLAFGGAGPMHAWALAQNLGIPKIIVPPAPGLHSALGLLATDLRCDQTQTVLEDCNNPNYKKLSQTYKELESALRIMLHEQGVSDKQIRIQRLVDLRYRKQAYELTLQVPSGRLTSNWIKQVVNSFHQHHLQQYGYSSPKSSITIVNLRVIAIGPIPTPPPYSVSDQADTEPEPKELRDVYFEEFTDFVKTPVYERSTLGLNVIIQGPAVIEQLDSTTVIHPNTQATVQTGGNLLLEGKK